MQLRDQVDLDQPAFPTETSSEGKENTTAQPSQSESGEVREEEKGAPVEPTSGGEENPVVEEQRVPYSRFETAHRARREAEARAEEAQMKLNELMTRQQQDYQRNDRYESNDSSEFQGKIWSRWTKLYGDTPQSREAFQVEMEIQKDIREEARRGALDAVRQERYQVERVEAQNEEILQSRLDDMSMGLGRPITKAEEDALLTIVDEWTPKDRDGNYAGELIPFEKAWEILDMRQQASQSKSRESRRVSTTLTSSRSDGEPSSSPKENKAGKVRWGSWKDRIPE